MKLVHAGLLLLVLSLLLLPGSEVARGYGDDSSVTDHAVNDMWQPSLEGNIRDRLSWRFDTAGGMKYKLKTVKLLGERHPAVQFKSGQDDGYGFFNAGLRMGLDWEVRATYAFPKSKGLRAGISYAAAEVDFPYTPVGSVPPSFLVAGVTYQNDGLSTFANQNGSTVGSQRSYPGVRAVDLRIRYRLNDEFTISTRPYGRVDWDVIFDGDANQARPMPVGVGFGLANVDRKAQVYLTRLCAVGSLFESFRQDVLDDIQEAIDLEQEALDASDLGVKRSKLAEAFDLIEDLGEEISEDYDFGDVDLDIEAFEKAVRKILSKDGKVIDSLDRPLPEFGRKDRKRIEKAIRKKRALAEIIQDAEPDFF